MSTKMIPLICPRCGANIEIAEGTKVCYCTYCGTKMVLDDDSQTININYNYNYTKNDIARVKEAEYKFKESERAHQEKEITSNNDFKTIVACLIFGGIMILLLFIGGATGFFE